MNSTPSIWDTSKEKLYKIDLDLKFQGPNFLFFFFFSFYSTRHEDKTEKTAVKGLKTQLKPGCVQLEEIWRQ